MTPDQFLASIDRHQQQLASQPDPSEEFARVQFQKVVDAVMQANKELLKYMKSQRTVSVDNLPTFPDVIKTPDVAEVTKAVKALEKSLKPVKQDNSDVISAIKELAHNQISAADIAKAAKAPIVNLPAPIVNVPKQELDLSPITKAIKENRPAPVDNKDIIKALKDVSQQIIKKPTPVANTPTDPLIKYTPADIDDAGAVQYFGFIDAGGGWYIRRFDTSSSPKTLRFCFGNGGAAAYQTAFTNRTSQTYALWSQ